MSRCHEFIGRVGELEELNQFVRSPEQSIFVLIGKAGMGKSALVRQLDSLLQQDQTGKLPSIAIFVDGDALIDPLVEQIHPLLAEHNILVVGCKGGRVVGDNLEVCVFDVRHIKGLEFEAVFFHKN